MEESTLALVGEHSLYMGEKKGGGGGGGTRGDGKKFQAYSHWLGGGGGEGFKHTVIGGEGVLPHYYCAGFFFVSLFFSYISCIVTAVWQVVGHVFKNWRGAQTFFYMVSWGGGTMVQFFPHVLHVFPHVLQGRGSDFYPYIMNGPKSISVGLKFAHVSISR